MKTMVRFYQNQNRIPRKTYQHRKTNKAKNINLEVPLQKKKNNGRLAFDAKIQR